MIGIKELDLEILRNCDNIKKCSLVCKEWKAAMDYKKSLIRAKIYNSRVLLAIDTKLLITNYKTMRYRTFYNKAVEDVIKSNVISTSFKKNIIIGVKPGLMSADYIHCVSDLNRAAKNNSSMCVLAGTKKLMKMCNKKIKELLYCEIVDKVIVLVFKNQIILGSSNVIYKYDSSRINFINYKNGVIYFEFAGGIYETNNFSSVKFIRWISEY